MSWDGSRRGDHPSDLGVVGRVIIFLLIYRFAVEIIEMVLFVIIVTKPIDYKAEK
jgi:hypothetical protein